MWKKKSDLDMSVTLMQPNTSKNLKLSSKKKMTTIRRTKETQQKLLTKSF